MSEQCTCESIGVEFCTVHTTHLSYDTSPRCHHGRTPNTCADCKELAEFKQDAMRLTYHIHECTKCGAQYDCYGYNCQGDIHQLFLDHDICPVEGVIPRCTNDTKKNNMTDKQFLIWIHERLRLVHSENEHVDYMYKLRSIIESTPPEKYTPNTSTFNSIAEMYKEKEHQYASNLHPINRR